MFDRPHLYCDGWDHAVVEVGRDVDPTEPEGNQLITYSPILDATLWKKVRNFPVPSREVTNQTVPGQE